MNAHTHYRLGVEPLESRRLLAVEVMLTGAGEGLDLPSTNLNDVTKVDICGCGDNVITLDAEWIGESCVDSTVKVVADTGDRINLTDTGWKFAGAQAEGEEIVREFENHDVVLNLVGPDDFTNPINAYDVNGNGEVTSLDVLVIINELAERRFSDPQGGTIGDPATIPLDRFKFFDVSGNHTITSLDALRVINRLPMEANAEDAVIIGKADGVVAIDLLASDPVIAQQVSLRDVSSDLAPTEKILNASYLESTSTSSVPRIQGGELLVTYSSKEGPTSLNASLVDSLMLDEAFESCLGTQVCSG